MYSICYALKLDVNIYMWKIERILVSAMAQIIFTQIRMVDELDFDITKSTVILFLQLKNVIGNNETPYSHL